MEKTPTFQVQAFGAYYLLERIAVGGMAEIFKAKQIGVRGFEKILVIKKILHHLSEDPEFVEMFEDEAKIAAQLTQANIVQIYELGEVAGTLYITMEYVEGKNLRDITRNCAQNDIHLSVDQCVFLMSEVLKGLDYAHRKSDSSGRPLSIVHRDMSPQNIIVSHEGEVKILDFGIAKAASKISKTEAGVLKGKFSYMSPEQASGKVATQTTDIYACGVILHELLTSERLFRLKSDMETLERVKEGIVQAPSEKNPLVPRELDMIVLKALSKDISQRYQTAGEMLNDLNKLSLMKNFRYSSQDLAAFMKSLFSESIAEEKNRLIEALERIPPSTTDQILNAQTNISFKRTVPQNSKAAVEEKNNSTFTISKKMSGNKRATQTFLAALALICMGFFTIYRLSHPSEPVSEESREAIPPAQNKGELVVPVEPDRPQQGTVDSVFKNVDRMPLDLAPLTKKKPKATVQPNQSDEPKTAVGPKGMGTMDVMAPPEGFAQLHIDGKKVGTVPGPKARGISLEEGSHIVQCETLKKSYSGRVQILPNELVVVRCQDLRSN